MRRPLIRPRPVPPGATIGIIAPASPSDANSLAAGVARLHAWGYRTLVDEQVLQRRGYLSGSDQDRAAAFNRVWANPEVDAVICARGGYGCMRILPEIDWELIRRNPKFFCGFSDITALHLAIARETGLITFHGPMVAAPGDAEEYNGQGLLRALRSSDPLGPIPWPDDEAAPKPVALRPGTAEGPLVGGNLTLLAAMLGTPWEPDLDGAILLVEDVDEEPYRVDRMLTQLRLAGKLQRVAGILFGDSPSCEPAPGRESLSLLEVLTDRLADLQVPILYGFPCGHTAYRATLPLGVRARLDASAGSLTILEPALA